MLISSSYFTTDAYPGSDRQAAWAETLGRLSLQSRRAPDRDDVRGSIRSIETPQGLTFARMSSGAQSLVGLTDKTRKGLWLALHIEGKARLRLGDGSVELSPGDVAMGPMRPDFHIAFESPFRQLFVRVPQTLLNARLLGVTNLRDPLLVSSSGLGQVFAGFLQSVAERIEEFDTDNFQPIEIALTEFLATSLASESGSGGLRGATSTQMAILNRICQQIEARLGEHELNRDDVAESEGISPRYLQKLFENAGETFVHYLRLRRLERCRSDLINPLYSHLSITDICFRWGFNDSAHFSRAFRERFNVSPRTYRKTMGGAISEKVRERVGRGWPKSAEKLAREAIEHTSPGVMGLPLPATITRALEGPAHHYLPANDKTVHWGFVSKSLPPVLTINSGDAVTVETLTHHANDDYDRMVKGDSGVESVFRWNKDGKAIERRGAGPMDASVYGRGAGEGFGVHLCTGPIAITDAEPGDVLELRILKISPRASANAAYEGKAFGSNAATWWGFHYNDLLTEPKNREVVTIYEVDCCGSHARAAYNFRWTPQRDPFGVMHPTIDYPGIPVDHSTIQKNFNVLKGVRIPLRPHFGFIGVAPKDGDLVDSIPPSYFGGNLDNWRAGQGSAIYLPVSVPGALLSIGDPHASQGDSELCGTAIECSMTGMFQVILHKKHDLPGKPFADLDYPLLETEREWVVHGFSFANYQAELGEGAQSEIYKRSSLDPAMRDAFWKMRRFLMVAKGLSEDEAISLISVAVDFGVTQVVDGNWCVHAVLRKSLFECSAV